MTHVKLPGNIRRHMLCDTYVKICQDKSPNMPPDYLHISLISNVTLHLFFLKPYHHLIILLDL